MAAKLIVPLMMASFLLLGASSTSSLDVEYDDNFALGGNGGREDDVRAEDPLVITDVMWTADGEVSLTVCWDQSLNARRENMTGIYLNVTFPGVLDEAGFCALSCELYEAGCCALFNVSDGDFKLPSIATKYTVDAEFSDGPSMTGSATFAMTVETTLLDCGGSSFTKVSWANETTVLLNLTYIEEPTPPDSSCYYIGDLSNQAICFTVPSDDDPPGGDITVCLNGPTDHKANLTNNNSFSVDYLQYGEGNDLPFLSLTSDVTVDAVIIGTDKGHSTVHRCDDDNACQLTEQFKPSTNHYQVCGDLSTMTATTIFDDLQVTIFEAASASRATELPSYLHFVFANALPGKTYNASLWQFAHTGDYEPLTSVNIDCTHVAAGHGCFGVLDTDSLEGPAYVAVASGEDGSNQVNAPYNTGIATTTTTEQTTTSKTSEITSSSTTMIATITEQTTTTDLPTSTDQTTTTDLPTSTDQTTTTDLPTATEQTTSKTSEITSSSTTMTATTTDQTTTTDLPTSTNQTTTTDLPTTTEQTTTATTATSPTVKA